MSFILGILVARHAQHPERPERPEHPEPMYSGGRGAGASARRGYLDALARRRRAAGLTFGLALIAVGAAWAANDSGGRLRLILIGTAIAVALGAVLSRPTRDPERWLRGAAGEQATAILLDRLSSRRWAVFHDLAIPGSRANIDHLVIGPTGVWAVDTKTSRAPVRSSWRGIWLGSRRLDPGPSRWEAQVASDLLGVKVRPVIAVHGDGLHPRGRRTGGVRVVPAESLVRRLRRGRKRLSRRDVAYLAQLAVAVWDQPREKEVSLDG